MHSEHKGNTLIDALLVLIFCTQTRGIVVYLKSGSWDTRNDFYIAVDETRGIVVYLKSGSWDTRNDFYIAVDVFVPKKFTCNGGGRFRPRVFSARPPARYQLYMEILLKPY